MATPEITIKIHVFNVEKILLYGRGRSFIDIRIPLSGVALYAEHFFGIVTAFDPSTIGYSLSLSSTYVIYIERGHFTANIRIEYNSNIKFSMVKKVKGIQDI